MTAKQIKKYCKEAHDNSIEKGFYDCPECNGEPHKGPCDHIGCYSHVTHPCEGCGRLQGNCVYCKGTGMDPNPNIFIRLALINSEIYEALKAHIENRFCGELKNWSKDHLYCLDPEKNPQFNHDFERNIKDTFEDEIADTFIRIFEMCECFKLNYIEDSPAYYWNDIHSFILEITEMVCQFNHYNDTKWRDEKISVIINSLFRFCENHAISIERHIDLKMAYNKTRPRKHGKEY